VAVEKLSAWTDLVRAGEVRLSAEIAIDLLEARFWTASELRALASVNE